MTTVATIDKNSDNNHEGDDNGNNDSDNYNDSYNYNNDNENSSDDNDNNDEESDDDDNYDNKDDDDKKIMFIMRTIQGPKLLPVRRQSYMRPQIQLWRPGFSSWSTFGEYDLIYNLGVFE